MSSANIAAISIAQVKRDIYQGIVDCSARGLIQTAKWLSEVNFGLVDPTTINIANNNAATRLINLATPKPATLTEAVNITNLGSSSIKKPRQKTAGNITTAAAAASNIADDGDGNETNTPTTAASAAPLTDADRNPPLLGVDAAETDAYYMAKTFFDCREYTRAAHFTEKCKSPVPQFLHLYALYMAKEKRRLDHLTDSSNLHRPGTSTKDIQELVNTMRAMHAQRKLDGYGLYLYGVVLKRIDLIDAATRVLEEAVRLVPTLWAAWLELAPLITDRAGLMRLLSLGGTHWMGYIFHAHCLIVLFQNDEGLRVFEDLQAVGFARSTYITSQMAIAYHNKRSE